MVWKARHDNLRIDKILEKKYFAELSRAIRGLNGANDIQKYSAALEDEFSRKFGFIHSKSVGSGTQAFTLFLWLLSLNSRGKKAEVIVPAAEYYSLTSSFSCFPDIKMRLCDVNPENFAIDTEKAEKLVNRDTKAIVAAHMFGNACNMKELVKIKEKNNLVLLEDACQAIGNKIDDKYLGSLGDFAIFSFSNEKFISSIGSSGGGMLTFKSEENAEKISRLMQAKELKGISRISLPAISSIAVQLRYFSKMQERHNKMKELYFKELSGINEIRIINSKNKNEGLYTRLVIQLEGEDERNMLHDFLKKRNILAELPYPAICIFSENQNRKFPGAEDYYKRCLHLPFFHFIKEDEIRQISAAVREFFRKK
ncbi:MAG: aminotransferase class V-fold PLP-dependent enzyme [archaeon]